MDQKLKQLCHATLALDDQIDVFFLSSQGDTLPTHEGLLLYVCDVPRLHVVSVQLKSWAEPSKAETIDILDERVIAAFLGVIVPTLVLGHRVKLIRAQDSIIMFDHVSGAHILSQALRLLSVSMTGQIHFNLGNEFGDEKPGSILAQLQEPL